MKDWLLREIATGIQMLLCSRLPGAPAADMVKGTILAWGAALRANGRVWDEARDVPRLQKAFAGLLAECEEWPSAKSLLRALPSTMYQAKLPPPSTYPMLGDESPRAVAARQRHLARLLKVATNATDASKRAPAPEARA